MRQNSQSSTGLIIYKLLRIIAFYWSICIDRIVLNRSLLESLQDMQTQRREEVRLTVRKMSERSVLRLFITEIAETVKALNGVKGGGRIRCAAVVCVVSSLV